MRLHFVIPSVNGSPRAALMKFITSKETGAAPVTQILRFPPIEFLRRLKSKRLN